MPAWTAGRLLLASAAVGLAGCTAHQPPTATPVAAPVESEWTVSDRGYGPVRIGMTPEEASAVLGRPLLPLAAAADEACSYVLPDADVNAEIAFMTAYGRIVRVDLDEPGIATDAGVEVGDSEAAALAHYPAATVQPHKYGDAGDHYLVVTTPDGAHALVIETWDGKVSSIRAGQLPEAGYVEGCS